MRTMKSLKEYVYTSSGRSINARMNEQHLRANGYSTIVDKLLTDTSEFSDMTFTERLRMFIFDKIYINHCKTCNKILRVWEKHDWKKFCCMSCAQNDPDVKSRILSGQSKTDWSQVVQKRDVTMKERYGYENYSKSETAKQEFANRTKAAWSDVKLKEKRLENRIKTNIERYGVEHTSQRQEQRISAGKAISNTYNTKSDQQKSILIDEYRKSRLSHDAYSVLTTHDLLNDLYSNQKLSVIGIARHLKCSWESVLYSLQSHDIPYDPTRFSVTSDLELELFTFIKSLAPNAISTYKDGKHLDIFIPELNLGFEFNGVYWHSEAKKSSDYHVKKVQYFYDRGIRYIQIWEDDWLNKRSVVEKFIRNLLGYNKRIGARQTTIVELTHSEFSTFMNANHMQGTTSTSIRLGLVYDGIVVAAMGFKHVALNTSTKGKTIELVRFANINVTGAFTKLLKYVERNYQYEYITSFADLEIVDMNNNVYSKHGFVVDYTIKADYKYYNYRTNMREHKFGYRKSKFKSLGFDVDGKSEHELAIEYGLLRCYDSGKIKYVKTNNLMCSNAEYMF